MGQASREADGWENVTGNLRESWKQLLAVVGQPILQVATQVVKRLSSALATLTEYAKGAVESLSKVFGWDTGNNTASNIKSASDSAKSLTDTADDSSKSLDNVQKSSEKAKRSVAGFDKLNVLSSSDSSSSKSDTSSSKALQAVHQAELLQRMLSRTQAKTFREHSKIYTKKRIQRLCRECTERY